jgi:hypothetical protein
MIGVLLLAAAAFGTQAKIETGAAAVAIGEPFEITFVVEHETGATVKLPDPSALPPAFAFVADLGLRHEIDPAHSGVTTTRARWRVMALEGGALEFPAQDIGIEGGGVNQVLHASGPKLDVAHALKEGEDAPRPARGFRDTPLVRAAGARLLWIGAGVLGLVFAFIGFKIARRKKKPAPIPVASAAARLAELAQTAQAEPERAREHVFALTSLVRGAIDESVGENRAALSDEDWVRVLSADARVPETSRAIAAKLLADAERVKYAGEVPSILAVRDVLAQANTALAALPSTKRTAA